MSDKILSALSHDVSRRHILTLAAKLGVSSLMLEPILCGNASAQAIEEAFVHDDLAPPKTYVETPFFQELVATGTLPPVQERVPKEPFVRSPKNLGRVVGKQGGALRMLMGDTRDNRFMTVYGYTRLVVFNRKLELEPDLLLRVEVEDEQRFTLVLRKDHQWSDGAPFTAEDFRYMWEDVYFNKRLSPSGPPPALSVNGKFAQFDVLDETRVRYSFDAPAPFFLPALADSFPLYLQAPAHYLKQFHERYADKDALAAAVKAEHVKDWGSLYERRARQFRPDNPDLPTLDPWRPRTQLPSELLVFERNPFFHRVDSVGQQLPYLDRVQIAISSTGLIAAKTGAGDTDLQARFLNFSDYTFLKDAETRQNFSVRLWEKGEGSFLALYPNLNAKDDVWRALMRDTNFRRALSLGIARHDINQILFYGLARESANTILSESPLYQERYAKAYTDYDTVLANNMLDAVGLNKRDSDNIRLLPDGRRAEFTIETAGDSTVTDLLALVCEGWLDLGLKAFVHSSSLDVFRKRVWSGEAVMSADIGLDNAAPSAKMEPISLCPSLQSQFQWPLFGQYVESNGREGTAIDMPEVLALADLHRAWRHSRREDERVKIWTQILDIHAREVFSIGIVNGTLQPVVVSNRLGNVPEKALYAYEPTAYFGAYHPDLFFFHETKDDS